MRKVTRRVSRRRNLNQHNASRLPWHEEHIEADHVFFCPSVRHIPIAYLGVAPRARLECSNGLADYLYAAPIHLSTRRHCGSVGRILLLICARHDVLKRT